MYRQAYRFFSERPRARAPITRRGVRIEREP
jgi:hypothetical protein